MLHNRSFVAVFNLLLFYLFVSRGSVLAQQEVGFIEKFALAENRQETLSELIPGTAEYFYFHCLHYQNERQLGLAQETLDAWRAKLGATPEYQSMHARQMLLAYGENPARTIEYLRSRFGIQHNHAPPSRDRAAELPTELDNTKLATEVLLEQAFARDRSLGQIETEALHLALERQLNSDQLRSVLSRLERADAGHVVESIAQELALKDSKGFGWAPVHRLLTLEQLKQLLDRKPDLTEDSNFVQAYAARLLPPEGSSLDDPSVKRQYLDRLRQWASQLPDSKNSFKALVIGNLLRLNLADRRIERDLFVEYLSLPRSAPYYRSELTRRNRPELANLSFKLQPTVPLPPMLNDEPLVRRYLELFLKDDPNVDAFSQWVDREYLERVQAEAKILYGIGDKRVWYAKLEPSQQKQIRERVEIGFAPHNPRIWKPADPVSLEIEVKNVDELTIRIYEINTLAFYREQSGEIGTDIDLDGLVPNWQRQLEFAQAAEIRHAESIALPELEGRGVWVVDLLGGGRRSRALIRKGELLAVERPSDAGHVLRVVDEQAQVVEGAYVEFAGRRFEPDERGEILIPFAENTTTREATLVSDQFASRFSLTHRRESYQLLARFLMDRQSLVAGRRAKVAIRSRLNCNGLPISVELLQHASLRIVATDADGIQTSQQVPDLDLHDGEEFTYDFLVPQRLREIEFELTGKIYNQSRDERQDVECSFRMQCNEISDTAQIADFYLQQFQSGYRLLVLGRNGEPISKLPVSIRLKHRFFTQMHSAALATDESGSIALGKLDSIESIDVAAQGIQQVHFDLAQIHRDWPKELHRIAGSEVRLPLGTADSSLSDFSLQEVRAGMIARDIAQQISVQDGGLVITGLEPGDYLLKDFRVGSALRIRVSEQQPVEGTLVDANRILQAPPQQSVTIRGVELAQGLLTVKVDGADAASRVHVFANVFQPSRSVARAAELPHPDSQFRSRRTVSSHYVDALKLDEEYGYILQRQGADRFSGNMLPQPSLLVRPWELAETENLSRAARAGDAMPASPESSMAREHMDAEFQVEDDRVSPNWKCFDFLSDGEELLANVAIEDGVAKMQLEDLSGFSSLTVLVVNPTSLDSRVVPLELSALKKRDLRMRSAFDANIHLAQTQKVEILKAATQTQLGDPRTRRWQIFDSLSDVFQLYSTILQDGRWEKFRFVTNWPELTANEKQAHYSEMACHELNFFLYHKDPEFFTRVVRPAISQKLAPQLFDQWLLDKSLAEFQPLWKQQRLNALERILLASKLEDLSEGTKRWIGDYIEANPLETEVRKQRFELALRGSALQSAPVAGAALYENLALAESAPTAPSRGRGGAGGAGGGMYGGRAFQKTDSSERSRELRQLRSKSRAEAEDGQADDFAFGAMPPADRLGRGQLGFQTPGFFQSLDKTKEWAESQYFELRLSDQVPGFISPNPFWLEYIRSGGKPFLPENLDLPVDNLSEALCALAVIDLPFGSPTPKVEIEDNELVVESSTPAIVYLESIEECKESDQNKTILVGQDIYLSQPSGKGEPKPVSSQSLLKGTPYRASVVVSNPTSAIQQVSVLAQLPAGAIPLSASKATKSFPMRISPYSTSHVEYAFYFPVEGAFEHYGAQVSEDGFHITHTDSTELRVLAEPESIDGSTWQYVAQWGSDEQVLEFLRDANLLEIDLSLMAFRLGDAKFYDSAVSLLAENQHYDASVWAYAFRHNDPAGIRQWLQTRHDLVQQVGPVLESSICEVLPAEQFSYEHLDYKPLVVARVHQLGAKRSILNPSLRAHYHKFLNVLAHQNQLSAEQRLQLCYYLTLQYRISEASSLLQWISRDAVQAKLQYDYLDAYLCFYLGDYDRANQLADEYVDYPVEHWGEMFESIRLQIHERNRLLTGRDVVQADASNNSELDAGQRILVDRRGERQDRLAESIPKLDMKIEGDELLLEFANLESVTLNYYLMDIELLFSRKPFVAQDAANAPLIRPNVSVDIELSSTNGKKTVDLPPGLRNKNVFIEARGGGITRGVTMTANALQVEVAEPYGQLQVFTEQGRAPVEGAYVKVYARHRDGNVRFYKDGYTDLRGRFDYATLSTADLDTAKELAILVLDRELGAVIQEADPPTR